MTELVVGLPNKPLTLQSWRIRDGVSSVIGNQIHRGLIRRDPETGQFLGAIAERWETNDNPAESRFFLKKNILFHNGKNLTCGDVKFSFERLVQKKIETSIRFPKETSFQCEDGHTFVIRLPFVPAQLLDILASPAAAVSDKTGLVGLGPYRLTGEQEDSIQLESVVDVGPKQLLFRIATAEALTRQFSEGKVDDILYLGHFTSPKVSCLEITGLSPTVFWFGLNARNQPLKSETTRKRVKRLLELALDSTSIFKEEQRSISLIPFGVPGHRSPASDSLEAEIRNLRGSIAKGLIKGKLRFGLRKINQSDYRWSELFSAADPKREIFAFEFLDNNEFFESYYQHRLDLFYVGGNITRNDPFEVLSFFRSDDTVNPSGVTSDQVDQLANQAASARTLAEVRDLATRADAWVLDHAYAVPLFSKRFRGCVRHGLTGYRLSPLGQVSLDYSLIQGAQR